MDAAAGSWTGVRGRRGGAGAALDDRGQVGRRRPAAPADGGHPEFGHEPVQVLGQVVGREVVVHLAVDHRREARIGDAGDGDAAGRREVAQRLAHLDRSGGAVEADHVDLHGVEHGERGADLGAGQHAAGELDRDLGLERHLPAERHHGAPRAVDGGLHGEQVELGLDQQEVDAALEEAEGLLLVGIAELGVGDVPQRGELGARAHGAGDPARALRAWRTRPARRRRARPPSGSGRAPGRPSRTRPARRTSSRTCRSRRRRSPPRRRSGGPGPRRRGASRRATRCTPRAPGRRSRRGRGRAAAGSSPWHRRR